MRNLFACILIACLIGIGVPWSSYGQDIPISPSNIKTGTYLGLSPAAHTLPVMTLQEEEAMWEQSRNKPRNEMMRYREFPYAETALPKGSDPVWQTRQDSIPGNRTTLLNFNGQQSGVFPPDPCGDVGPNHYIQAYNSAYVIYDKQGNTLAGPTNLNLLFGSVPGSNCNSGDPIVIYDEQANRWVIIEFSLCNPNQYVLFAVSQTADPTGSWYSYSFDTDETPDYEKVGVWRDGYYMATNTSPGRDIYVVERSVMLTGGANPKMVGFDNAWRPASTQSSPFMCVPPVDNDGTFAPSGSPGIFVAFNDDAVGGGSDQLWIYELAVNWSNTAASTFNRVQQINVAAFDSNFGTSWDNITQPGTAQKLDGVPIIIMNAPQYRNFGTYQTLVCCHTVDVDNTNHAGVRWYELRRTSGNWSVRQQGTFSPDGTSRWMGSIRLNNHNEIGLGYSVSSSSVYPGVRYCGQDAIEYAKASGVMNVTETIITNGSYSQSGMNRWGDYTSLNVDPADERVFWYTNMHVLSNTTTKRTVIASFTVYPLNLYVDKTAAAGGNGTLAAPIQTVTQALNALGPGTNVYIKSNTYDEATPMNLNQSGMWQSYNGGSVIK